MHHAGRAGLCGQEEEHVPGTKWLAGETESEMERGGDSDLGVCSPGSAASSLLFLHFQPFDCLQRKLRIAGLLALI